MKLTLGETLYRLRIERNIEAKQICEGLCDEATLSRARDEARAMDGLLFECIVGRMGVSSEEFTLMLTESEYGYRQWQEAVYIAIEAADWDTLKVQLNYDIRGKAWINEKLQMQFYHYANGIYFGSQMRYKEAYEELKSAQEKTILRQMLQDKNLYLNTMELHILMLLLFYGMKGELLDDADGKELFHCLEEFVYDGILDINEKARIYPKLVCMGLHCLQGRLTEEEQKMFCEKAVRLLRKNKTFFCMTDGCNLRRRAAADAVTNGHPAVINGRFSGLVFE